MQWSGRKAWMAGVLAAALLAGCASTSVSRAPVEDRNVGTAAAVPGVDAALLPGAENAGKPGYYTVRAGDTIMKIATEVGQPWREIVGWNKLDNPNAIEVGQVLRVVPPVGSASPQAVPAPVEAARGGAAHSAGGKPAPVPVATQTTPGAATPAPVPASAAAAPAPAASAATAAAAPPPPPPPPPSAGADNVKFIWPAKGPVIARFDEDKNKGLGIGGKAGEPVLAAADGRVVYAGAGLRGYGNLIIIKHNNTFLTAYAHNQKLLVKEDQNVKKGQEIAEMGSTDSDRVKLHFEIRRSGKPVDPARYLPPR
ncbi:MAG: peptidoglycan DD-metalloendopeptidase family protein [Burkholderiaceae bacterium]|nr:peptidoglycan DD-metalloendopeptidase family protein [Pseudomonadota bacterium]MBS0597460.1 peptidoglycan DD-metalloendopeptidase family protein [Pseudomonadota bacterium]MCO5114741.1 peptidoglycan DD-metalloendopeptidase family protein [Burkholderiaceae bacterium]MCP5218872.1 peptidoglycan DD-metalloendopeptidase family protein [Burkholderiaceae bacterium]